MSFAHPPPLRRLVVAIVAVVCVGCASLPSREGVQPSHALPAVTDSPLAKNIQSRVREHPGLSGFVSLEGGLDAYVARVVAAGTATRSLDVQSYIWRGDRTGALMLEQLRRAARRGVRVRLLLDDNSTLGIDPAMAEFDALPNVEVRLFNPFMHRGYGRLLDYAGDFSRLNRRMHNKSFTADGVLTIVGGRNIGDEYFDADPQISFADLDVLAVGTVVPEVQHAFDLYWNSESAYPLRLIVQPPVSAAKSPEGGAPTALDAQAGAGASAPSELDKLVAKAFADPGTAPYERALRESPLAQRLGAGGVEFEWGAARLVYDDPIKAQPEESDSAKRLIDRLLKILGPTQKSLDLVSPYLVLSESEAQAFVALAGRGARVRMLTNSLASTDVAAVHAGYIKSREALLRGGVEIYELKPQAKADGDPELLDARKSTSYSVGGSSRASLHAKTFAADRQRVFVGSFNLDQRSIDLNTEMGVLLDNARLAGRIDDAFDTGVPKKSYRVTLEGDALKWSEETDNGPKTYDSEPGVSAWRRFMVWLMSLLPLDPLL